MTTTCPTCDLGLHHCHAVLVEHDDGTVTCLDACGGPRTVHDDVLPCAEAGLGCCAGHGAAEPAGARGIAPAALPVAA